MSLPPLPWIGPLPQLPGALCASTGSPESWFATDPAEARTAARICQRCPERQACLAYAVGHSIEDGIWGGTTPEQRGQPRQRAAG